MEIKKYNDFISLILMTIDQTIHTCIVVNKHNTSAELIMLLHKTIKEIKRKPMNDYFFLYNGRKLIFNAHTIETLNIKNGDVIIGVELESKYIINKKMTHLYNLKKPEDLISVLLISSDQSIHISLLVNKHDTSNEFIILLYKAISEYYPEKTLSEFYFIYDGNKLNFSSQTVDSLKIHNGAIIMAYEIKPLFKENLDIDASIIVNYENDHPKNYNFNLCGLLKLCLIKDISLYIFEDYEYYKNKLSNKMKYILELISGGNIDLNQKENSIMSILKKFEGINIVNFAKFIDAFVTKNEFNELFSILKDDIKTIIERKNNCLGFYVEYMKKFEEEFEKAKKQSVFEYRITSLTIVDRSQINDFEINKNNCPNRKDRILFHGTGIEPSAKILTNMFLRSEKSGYQHGKGVYFTDSLDYAWYYGGKDNRSNLNKIPKVEENFILVGSFIYYNNNGFKRVYDYKYTPKTNEINFAYANSETRTIFNDEPDRTKFYGTEYVIFDTNQICPFLGLSLKRDEFCVIWRDVNFSANPIYNNRFDEIFKKFLKKRMLYIQEQIKFNVYPCETSEEALNLIRRKKYNKIILISNVGDDCSGRQFIIDARKIIGSEVITLFLCYNIAHLKWVKNFKNSLFSNEPEFYENYLQCFLVNSDLDEKSKEKQIKFQILKLIEDMEKKYKVKFNIHKDFLNFPYYKNEGKFSDLSF